MADPHSLPTHAAPGTAEVVSAMPLQPSQALRDALREEALREALREEALREALREEALRPHVDCDPGSNP